MSTVHDALAKGRELERQIERFFHAGGYETERNVIAAGKSGGRHEIDVLAHTSNGVSSFMVMVECKAWSQPIERDVVAKANFVATDLGLNKAIVVSLAGCRVGAQQAAQQFGIELWYSFEIEKRLGKAVVEAITASGASRPVPAVAPPHLPRRGSPDSATLRQSSRQQDVQPEPPGHRGLWLSHLLALPRRAP